MGVDECVVFPNFGLLWERPLERLDPTLGALKANMTAWNRWCATVAADGQGRVHPVAHCTLRDPDWLLAELERLEHDGVELAMIAPAIVNDRPMSHPDHDVLWQAFVDHGVTPVFHVANQRRPFDEAWYTEPEDFLPPLETVFLWTPAALACTDLILNGTLDKHPDLRIGIVELSAVWVPMFLMMLDGGPQFAEKLNGRPLYELAMRPSDYFRRQVRVSSFAYELPARLIRQTGDLYMCCSDYPHSEGTATPLTDYDGLGGSRRTRRRARSLPRQRRRCSSRDDRARQRWMSSSSGSEPWNHRVVSTRLAMRHPSGVRMKSSS